MAENSNIAWTDHTWNPWQGCRKVSLGCLNCYMFRDKKRYGQNPSKVVRSKPPTFNKPLRWKEPAKVFVCSWSDFFIEDADPWRDEAWSIIRNSRHLTFLLLTKRPENIKARLPEDWPLPNVWLGVTAENQEQADKRISLLLSVEASVRFLSIEPMLGPIDLRRIKPWHLKHGPDGADCLSGGSWGHEHVRHMAGQDSPGYCNHSDGPRVDWVICGGESGPNAREMKEEWAKDVMAQCLDCHVPFFMKQMSGSTKEKREEIPEYLNVREFPKN